MLALFSYVRPDYLSGKASDYYHEGCEFKSCLNFYTPVCKCKLKEQKSPSPISTTNVSLGQSPTQMIKLKTIDPWPFEKFNFYPNRVYRYYIHKRHLAFFWYKMFVVAIYSI